MTEKPTENICCKDPVANPFAIRNPPVSDSLKYYSNLDKQSVERMKQCRRKFIEVARYVEESPPSRERSLCLTHIESAQMYMMKHLCMIDPQAAQDDPFEGFMDKVDATFAEQTEAVKTL